MHPEQQINITVGEKNSHELQIADTPEAELAQKNATLQELVELVTPLVRERNDGFVPVRQLSKDVAEAVKRRMGFYGFRTVIYGLGGPDILGAAEFLPDTGGSVVPIGFEDVLDTQALVPRDKPIDTSVLDQQALDLLWHLSDSGYYSTPKEHHYAGRGTLGMAVNLAVAGVPANHFEIVREQTIQYKGTTTKLDIIRIQRGEQEIIQYMISGVMFPSSAAIYGPQREIVQAILDNFQDETPQVALSKASELRGISGIAPLLPKDTTVVFDNTTELLFIPKKVHLTDIQKLGDEVQRPANTVITPSWGYEIHPEEITVGKVE